MVKFINAVTGVEMWVDESRRQDYIDKGHKVVDEPKAEKPKRKRKTSKK